MKLAYLVSRYPAVSHTFIMREIEALREKGLEVHPFTIRAAAASELLTTAAREESRRTTALLPAGPLRVLQAHFGLLVRRPMGYLNGLGVALRHRPPGLRAAIWQLFYFVEAGLLATEIRSQGIDHVHAHFANVASTVAMLAARMTGIRWSLTLHGLSDFGNPGMNNLGFKVEHAAFIICISDFGRAQAMLHSDLSAWEHIHRIHCGMDTAAFAPCAAYRHGTDAGIIRVLNIARLGREKGHPILLQAVRELVARGTDVRCTIVGDGPERKRLQELARELGIQQKVVFAGSVGEDRIQSYYEDADIFVLPSFSEGLPVVLVEAMAKGIPVVASQVMGIPELVEHGKCGLLVPPGRVTALADAISSLARQPEMRSRFATAGRAKACREFDIRMTGEQLASLFQASSVTHESPVRAHRAGQFAGVGE